MRSKSHPFWNFSLRVYRSEGVEAACLALQDEWGLDVNLVLFCCFAAVAGVPTLSLPNLRQAVVAVRRWQAEVVRPLRAARRRIGEGFAAISPEWVQRVRKAIGAAELDAEYVEQLILSDTLPAEPRIRSMAARRTAAATNLANYFELAGVRLGEVGQGHMETILAASFQDS